MIARNCPACNRHPTTRFLANGHYHIMGNPRCPVCKNADIEARTAMEMFYIWNACCDRYDRSIDVDGSRRVFGRWTPEGVSAYLLREQNGAGDDRDDGADQDGEGDDDDGEAVAYFDDPVPGYDGLDDEPWEP